MPANKISEVQLDANPVESIENKSKDIDLPTRKLWEVGQDVVRPYEVHVTINSIDEPAPFQKLCDEFTGWAAANVDPKHGEVVSCKPIFIVLPSGVHKQQPMCSMFVHSNLDQAVRFGEIFGKYVSERQNYEIKRNKVEARWHSIEDGYPVVKGVPIGTQGGTHIYWEFHIKLVV